MRSILKRPILMAFLWLLVPMVQSPAMAQEGAKGFIDNLAKETVEILKATQADGPDRKSRLSDVLEEGFDLPYLAQLAVGRSWRDVSEDEQQSFIEVFSNWVLQSQSARLAQYAGENITVESSNEVSDSDSMVTTRISGGELQNPVQVDWRVREENGSYKIIDVVIEGVSMVVTYRNEFQPIVEQGGIAALEAELKSRSAA
jgi:phospholipid transport system substrate-binding protein